MSIGLVSNIGLRWLVQKWLMTDTSDTSNKSKQAENLEMDLKF